ncbi:hydroxyacylglutathione hydrolase [Psychromonas sp. KJ10-10]|uniref:hydroxyacylglutathione hydrolase n=1 Tax=Psychromonas sp. KJ10-10 TaxID=3391823 RepID=UPI0039B3CE36
MVSSQSLIIDAIIITHKHHDHIGGVETILSTLGNEIKLYSKNKLFQSVIEVLEGQQLDFFEGRLSLNVMEVPGHTLDHVVYFNEEMLFCGDTLFSAGCGRVFEGSHQQMFDSLSHLAHLPDELKVYCAHEYTESNLAFAVTIEPKNKALLAYIKQVAKKRQLGLPSIPSSIGLEKTINPFLRCDDPSLINHLQNHLATPLVAGLQTFTALRNYKDNF